jgi:outer membrane protein assembly factor BamB
MIEVNTRRLSLISVSLGLAYLLVSPAFMASGQQQPALANWNGGDSTYGVNDNYSPQNVINSSNVGALVPKWAWPVPLNNKLGDQGIGSSPIIENGIAYVLSQSQFFEAINAANGHILWSKILPISYNLTQNVLDSHPCTGPLNVGLKGNSLGKGCLPSGHYHDGSWAYTSQIYGRPLIWIDSNNYTVYAFDALTGDAITHLSLYSNPTAISGNFGFYDNVTPQMTIDEADKVMIVGASVADQASAGRGFIEGFSLSTNPPSPLWTSFLMPPQDGRNRMWSVSSVENMTHAYIFNGSGAVDLKTMSQSQLNSTLYADWGNFAFNGTEAFAGTGIAFGGPEAFDSKMHIMYVATGNPSPDWNATVRPGPNLWSDSVIAVNVLTGKFVWAFQSSAHDVWDYDCSWNVILANVTVSGAHHEAVLKSCKNGYTYALDAATGQMYWYFSPRGQSWFKASKLTTLFNPLNRTQMILPWQEYPSNVPIVQNPGLTGTPESNMAFDPTKSLLFVADFNNPQNISFSDTAPTPHVPITSGGLGGIHTCRTCVTNTTLYALDANTGQVKWSYFVPALAFRGGLTVSGGVVYMSGLDGLFRVFNEQTGALIKAIDFGSPTATQPAIGQDASGNTIVMIPTGVSEEFQGATPQGVEVPGYVLALGLPSSTTVTSTSSTGIDPVYFYASSAIAVVFMISTGLLAIMGRGGKR